MKKIYLLLLFTLFITVINAQSDTLVQQRRIQDSIGKYINKPFSVLYNDMGIKPKAVQGALTSKNKYVEWAHQFFYEDQDDINDDIYIYIEFEQPLLISETQKYQPYFLRNFNTQEYPTYADKIIKVLEVYPKPTQ
ncbi:MAG: hypothetical protein QM727_10255 [Niabella sp.]